jgi:hypothetical protein
MRINSYLMFNRRQIKSKKLWSYIFFFHFKLFIKLNQRVIAIANRFTNANFKTVRNKVVYTGKNNIFKLKLDDMRCHNGLYCNCSCFLKYAVCSHVFAYSSLNKLNFYDKEMKESHNFVQKKKKGRPANIKKVLVKDD